MQFRKRPRGRLARWAVPVLALAALIVAASAAGGPGPVFAAELAEGTDRPGDYLAHKKDELQQWVTARFAELDRRGEALQKKASAMGEKAKMDWREFETIVAANRKEIDGKLEEAKTVSAEAWEQIKQETERAMEGLERRYNALAE